MFIPCIVSVPVVVGIDVIVGGPMFPVCTKRSRQKIKNCLQSHEIKLLLLKLDTSKTDGINA